VRLYLRDARLVSDQELHDKPDSMTTKMKSSLFYVRGAEA
jgi:hypothetical protein